MSGARERTSRRSMALIAGLMLASGCSATFDNDNFDYLHQQDEDRWYTGGARFETPVDMLGDGSPPSALDRLVLDFVHALPDIEKREGGLPSATGVFGIQVFTPENDLATVVLPDDRPYAGWVYAGVARHETWLDPDVFRRDDEQSTVEFDVGLVGPVTHVEELQEWLHGVFNGNDAEGWDNQIDNELGLVLIAAHAWRLDYAEWEPAGGLAYDCCSRVEGAVGNVDMHAGVGGSTRLGLNLSRDLGPQTSAGRVARSALGGADRDASLYLFVDADGRFVAHNLFLDGNTFEDSNSVKKERFVGELAFGIGWERGPWRIAYSQHLRSEEFADQDEDQYFGSVTLAYTPVP